MKRIPLFLLFCALFTGLDAQHYCHQRNTVGFDAVTLSPDFSELQCLYDVKWYFPNIEVNDSGTYISGTTQIGFETIDVIDTLIFELKSYLEVDTVFIDRGEVESFFQSGNILNIIPLSPLAKEEFFVADISYSGTAKASGFFSGLNNRTDFIYNKKVTYTLSEPHQSSTWFPVKQDLHDKADSVRIWITTDSSLLAGSNGMLTNITHLEGGRNRYEWNSTYPIAYYLISIAVADYIDYSFYSPMYGRTDSLLVQNFIYDHPEIFQREKDNIDRTSDMILLFTELFGPYPFASEKYGHAMAPMGGGMEHQTMTTLQNFNFELVAHELAHQWFGNNVTCGSWQDIWINEGFASYAEYLALEFLESKEEAMEWMENAHSFALRDQTEAIYLSKEEAYNPMRIFNYNLSYKKGASILHMLRYEINNDPLFFDIFRSFQTRYADSVATAMDFLNVVNEFTAEPYDWFFDQWYYQAGIPIIQSSWRQLGDSLWIDSEQVSSIDEEGYFRMHMDYRVIFENGTDTLIRVLFDKTRKKHAFYFPSKVISVQIDPYVNNLAISTIFEYITDETIVEINPNPVDSNLYLNFRNEFPGRSLKITDIKGSVLYRNELSSNRNITLDLGFLKSGTYFLVLKENEKSYVYRFIKL